MKLSALKPLEKNPFKLKGDAELDGIAKSIQSFEKMMSIRKIVIDEDNQILGGNKRYYALKQLGYKTIPDEWIDKRTDLTEAEKREFIVKDNSHWGSTWDYELLAEWEVPLVEWGVPLEFESEEPAAEAVEDNYEVPDEIKTDIVLGDLITFEKGGNELHRLLCGDSTDSDSVARLMNGEKADMVFTDPPYGIKAVSKNGTVGGENLCKPGIYSEIIGDDTINTAKEFYNTCISFGFKKFIIWGGNYFTSFLPPAACWIIWDKRGNMNSDNFADGEIAWTSFNSPVRIKKQVWRGMIKEGEHDKRIHPTQKPVKICAELIDEYSDGDIFDGFLGSGTTMVASHQLNRKCYGMELDPKYCQVILDRMMKLDSELTVKVNGKEYINCDKTETNAKQSKRRKELKEI